MKLIQIALILLVACEIGCVEVRDKNAEATPETALANSTTSPQAESSPNDLRASIEPLERPNKYKVKLLIPKGSINLQKISPSELPQTEPIKQITTLTPELRVFTDSDVKAGQTYTYQIGQTQEGELVFDKEISVKIPQDYEFSPGFQWPDDSSAVLIEGYERIFLPRQASLFIGNHSVTLKGKILVANESVIQTFAAGTTATASQLQGRHGGRLILSFEKAVGALKIELRGEHGAAGINGAPYANAARAGQGSTEILAFGAPCGEFPGNAGESGAKGRPGTSGGNGGSSGMAVLNIADTNHFQLETLIEAGVGGRKGLGGPGQIGGASGVDCRQKPNGSKGPDGETGDSGFEGRTGETQSICLHSKTQSSRCF